MFIPRVFTQLHQNGFLDRQGDMSHVGPRYGEAMGCASTVSGIHRSMDVVSQGVAPACRTFGHRGANVIAASNLWTAWTLPISRPANCCANCCARSLCNFQPGSTMKRYSRFLAPS